MFILVLVPAQISRCRVLDRRVGTGAGRDLRPGDRDLGHGMKITRKFQMPPYWIFRHSVKQRRTGLSTVYALQTRGNRRRSPAKKLDIPEAPALVSPHEKWTRDLDDPHDSGRVGGLP